MILAPQQANKLLPLISNLDSYAAFLELIEFLHSQAYHELVYEGNTNATGKLLLLDELKQLRDRVKDSLHGRPELNQPIGL